MIKLGLYRHFKGKEVEVTALAKHSETLEEYVVYRHVEDQQVWVRPLGMFAENVERDGKIMPRFTFIDSEE